MLSTPPSIPTRLVHVTLAPPKGLLVDRYFYIVLVCALLAITLAYQIRIPFSIDVGGQIDNPLLVRFHSPERDKPTGTTFRWTNGNSDLFLPDWGAGNPVEIRLRVARWRPDDEIADLKLSINRLAFAEPKAAGSGWQEYAFLVTDPKFLASNDLDLQFVSDTFVPHRAIPGNPDTRKLGVTLDWIRLQPLQNDAGKWRAVDGFVWSPSSLPPLGLLLSYIGSALTLYAGLTNFRIPRRAALLVAACLSLLGAAALVWVRPYITVFAWTLFLTLLASLGAGLLARLIVPRFFAWGGVRARPAAINLLALLFAFAFLIKLDLLLYPQTISYDLLYHVHRFSWVQQGILYWTQGSPKDFLGLPAPYPPGLYLFLLPFANLVSTTLLIQLSGALLDSITIFFLYFLLKKYLDDGRAGIFAAWIYSWVPLVLIALSWGIYANIFGQLLTLILVLAIVEGFDTMTARRTVALVTLLFALTLISHSGILASLVPLFAVWIGLLLVVGHMWRSRALWTLVGSGAVASIFAFVIYYGQFLSTISSGASQLLNDPGDASAGSGAVTTLSFWQLLQPARTEYIAVDWYVYLAALLGFIWLIRKLHDSTQRGRLVLGTLVAAWLVAFVVFILLRGAFGFAPRYVNFAMPALALCAGVAWSWLYARGLIGRAISLGLALVLALQSLYHWYVLAMFKYH